MRISFCWFVWFPSSGLGTVFFEAPLHFPKPELLFKVPKQSLGTSKTDFSVGARHAVPLRYPA
ncbi:MAG: hypothetical protein D3909_07810 [Candidatus Electrothrix sp. ATG1]|nr:hypothetical protein [Candidatus Electrothrix sp. ATG1]